MRIPFRLVDVFTDRPLAGNQLCVVPGPAPLAAATMQAIAAEIGFSETTFVTGIRPLGYSMRIFTPSMELPFAGHPTLGTAYVLVSDGRLEPRAVQSTAAGDIEVHVDLESGSARMRQFPPTFGPRAPDIEAVAAACGMSLGDLNTDLPMEVVSTGLGHLIVPVRDVAALSSARPDPGRLEPLLRPLGVDDCYLFAMQAADRSPGQVRARMFTFDRGIVEDAATGSAAGPLGVYAVRYGVVPSGSMTISQGVEIGRPSTLLVDVRRGGDGWDIEVGGGVALVAAGEFDLPV